MFSDYFSECRERMKEIETGIFENVLWGFIARRQQCICFIEEIRCVPVLRFQDIV
jgi:hypothetical protein